MAGDIHPVEVSQALAIGNHLRLEIKLRIPVLILCARIEIAKIDFVHAVVDDVGSYLEACRLGDWRLADVAGLKVGGGNDWLPLLLEVGIRVLALCDLLLTCLIPADSHASPQRNRYDNI